MVSQILSFQQELIEVETLVRQEINFKAARFDELIQYTPDQLDNNACPAIVIAVGRACGYVEKQTLDLAAIVQFIYLADQVHRLMTDAPDLAEESRQFPVLVGDFLYGKFFLGLCQGKFLDFLHPLAEVISVMSQGTISRWLAQGKQIHKEEWIQILEKERSSLTGTAARLSAQLAGASPHIQEAAEQLGWKLGLAWAADREQLGGTIVEDLLAGTRGIIADLPRPIEPKPLYELVDYIHAGLLQF